MTLSQAIATVKSAKMNGLDNATKEAVQSTLDVLMITENPDELKAAGFDDDIMKLAAKLTPPKRKATAKGRTIKAKAVKATAKIKKAKASRKANARPRPKKAKPAAATTAVKAEAISKPKAKSKPKAPAKAKAAAKPKAEAKPKKPTADEKAKDKAMAEIKVLDRQIAAYEKRITDTSGTVNRIAASFLDQSKSIKNTLGALPDKLREELLMKRRKKAILARIIKRDAKYFVNAANTLKKSGQLPESLAADLESVSTSLGSLSKKAAEKRKESPKKEKGFLARIFG